jgi:hypothetical protein
MRRGVSMKRIALAFLVAPFPAAFIQSLVVGVWPKTGKGIFEHPASMFVAICLLFYLVEIALALPLYLALRKRLPQKPIPYGLVGPIMVLLPIVLGLAVAATRGGLSAYQVIYNVAFFGIGGFLAGVIFGWGNRGGQDLSTKCTSARPGSGRPISRGGSASTSWNL